MKILNFIVFCLITPLIMQAKGPTPPPVTFTSSNLPVIVIKTNGQTIVDEPKITADMGIIFNSGNARNNITDPFNHYNGKIGIEIRGQSSQSFPMKSYSIELTDNAGNSQDKSLFGLPKESDWVLYAPYTDKTLMRNFLAYTMSREMGHWAANCRFVEVILNGDYIGIYVFMEKIKRGGGRVNIPKIANTDISGDALSGGYIFSLDKEANAWFSTYTAPNSTNKVKPQFSYVYPKIENIVGAQSQYIKNYVDSFERALSGPQFQDPIKGFRKFIDVPSFIDFSIINEISKNVDGYRLSSYFHKNRNGKINAGPVWDYDLAFRNAYYCETPSTSGWLYNFNYICPSDPAALVPFWWQRFMEDSAYKAALRCRWKQVRSTSISLKRIYQLIDSVVTLTMEARQRHFSRWPVLGVTIWPNPAPIPTSYEGEISTLKNWISDRLYWIDNSIPNNGACYDYPEDIKQNIIIKLAPNPVEGIAQLSVQARNNQRLSMNIYDINGRMVWNGDANISAGVSNLALPTLPHPTGVYVLKIISSSGETQLIKMIHR
jgi:hypothetical protein